MKEAMDEQLKTFESFTPIETLLAERAAELENSDDDDNDDDCYWEDCHGDVVYRWKESSKDQEDSKAVKEFKTFAKFHKVNTCRNCLYCLSMRFRFVCRRSGGTLFERENICDLWEEQKC